MTKRSSRIINHAQRRGGISRSMYSNQLTVPGTSEERRVLKNTAIGRHGGGSLPRAIDWREGSYSRCTRAGCGLGPWDFRSTVMRIGKG